ncbi:MAG: arsenate reductase ArsC [Phototrophicaceae bacterium]
MATRVLFLCTHNAARSQMAEAFLRQAAGDQFEVYSAGLDPKPIHPYTIQVMDEVGIDIRQQTSKGVRQYMAGIHFNYAITVCADADQNCPHALWSHGRKLYWPFDDPAAIVGTEEHKLAEFRAVRDQIAAKIHSWVAELQPV